MKNTKKRMLELGYEETVQKLALTFQKLYSIKYGASGLRYNNCPERPGVHKENDGGAYSKYGWHMDAEGHGDQKCEEYSKCPDVFMKGPHDDGSSTCNDDPMYYHCDGDSCAYYEEYPEECGKHDSTCSGSYEYFLSLVFCALDAAPLVCFRYGHAAQSAETKFPP